MTTATKKTKTINGVKLLKNGVRDADGNYYPVRYSVGQFCLPGGVLVEGAKIYAKDICKGLPEALNPRNDSDGREDYFEADRVRFDEGTAAYEAIKVFAA